MFPARTVAPDGRTPDPKPLELFHSSFCDADHQLFHFAFAHAITGSQQLNFSRECRMQIYAIYFQKIGVGTPSNPKNAKRFC
jgi:hypothetical protein